MMDGESEVRNMGGGGGGGGAGDTTDGAAGARAPPVATTAEDVFVGGTCAFETTAAAGDGVEVTVCGWVNCM